MVIAVALPVATVLSIVRDWPTLATGAIAAIWLALLIVPPSPTPRIAPSPAHPSRRQLTDGSHHHPPLTALTVRRRRSLARRDRATRGSSPHRRRPARGLQRPTEQSRLEIEGDEDHPAVASGLTEQSALDATLSVDQLTEALQGTISADAKVSLGPLTISLAPFIHLIGRVLQSPRITGRLHRDGDRLILTAQVARERSLSWRVQRDLSLAPADPSAPSEEPVIDAMVRELALRIYTDLALDSTVRWEASEQFVEGLRRFRSCLRTPRGRKVNLRHAEQHFLEALAQDEDFPSAHYNLGVLYTELLGLATAAGRNEEARMHTSAAETSFGRAIEQAPARWDCHFAFAQIQLSHARYDAVHELCTYVQRNPTLPQEVRTDELAARALLGGQDDRRPTRGAVRQRARARSRGHRACPTANAAVARRSEGAYVAAVAGRAALTTGRATLLRHSAMAISGSDSVVRDADSLRRVRNTMARLIWLSRLGDSRAALQHYFGRWAMGIEEWDLAERQLGEAAGSLPTRAAFAADLALARQSEGNAQAPRRRADAADAADADDAGNAGDATRRRTRLHPFAASASGRRWRARSRRRTTPACVRRCPRSTRSSESRTMSR